VKPNILQAEIGGSGSAGASMVILDPKGLN